MDKPNPRAIAKRMIGVCEKLWHQGDDALRTAEDQQSHLRARRYDSGRAGKGTVDNSTMDVGCSRAEGKTLYQSLVGAMRDLETSVIRIEGLFEKIFGKAKQSEAQRQARQPGAGRCVACSDYMPGTREHRIKEGFCPACLDAWHKRSKGEIRQEFIARVRRNRGRRDVDEAQ